MGCQKLIYQTTEPLLKVVYRAEEADKKSVQRFLSRDPITYSWQSPYATFNNNPIYYADPSGAEGEPVDQETANSGGGEVGDTYTDINGSVFEKNDLGWIPQNQGNGGVPNPAPVDNTYAYIDKYMGGGKNHDSGKSLLDMLRDLENMMKGGLHIWGSGNYATNFAPKVHNKNTPEFDFSEFQEATNTYFDAVERGNALKTTQGKDAYEATKKKVKELEAALQNGNAEEIQAKTIELQQQIHKQDLPPLDYATKQQFFPSQAGLPEGEYGPITMDGQRVFIIINGVGDTTYTRSWGRNTWKDLNPASIQGDSIKGAYKPFKK